MSEDPPAEQVDAGERAAGQATEVGDLWDVPGTTEEPAGPDQDDATASADASEDPDRALGERVGDLEDDVDELSAAVQAVRGYVGGVKQVNDEVEQRADAALAKAEAVERALDGGARSGSTTASATKPEPADGRRPGGDPCRSDANGPGNGQRRTPPAGPRLGDSEDPGPTDRPADGRPSDDRRADDRRGRNRRGEDRRHGGPSAERGAPSPSRRRAGPSRPERPEPAADAERCPHCGEPSPDEDDPGRPRSPPGAAIPGNDGPAGCVGERRLGQSEEGDGSGLLERLREVL